MPASRAIVALRLRRRSAQLPPFRSESAQFNGGFASTSSGVREAGAECLPDRCWLERRAGYLPAASRMRYFLRRLSPAGDASKLCSTFAFFRRPGRPQVPAPSQSTTLFYTHRGRRTCQQKPAGPAGSVGIAEPCVAPSRRTLRSTLSSARLDLDDPDAPGLARKTQKSNYVLRCKALGQP